MNIFQKAYFALKLENWLNSERKEASTMNGTKPGWKTTEFWLNLVTQATVLWGAIHGFIPQPWATVIQVGGVAVYTVARTIAKAVSDIQAAKSGNAPAAA